jgi:hypothetical protein
MIKSGDIIEFALGRQWQMGIIVSILNDKEEPIYRVRYADEVMETHSIYRCMEGLIRDYK